LHRKNAESKVLSMVDLSFCKKIEEKNPQISRKKAISIKSWAWANLGRPRKNIVTNKRLSSYGY